MKKSDLATIVLIAGFSTIVAFICANILLGDPNEADVTLKYLDIISSELEQPDPELFNVWAVNPTVEVYVGQCRSYETWDSETKECVNNTPSSVEDCDSDDIECILSSENMNEPTDELTSTED